MADVDYKVGSQLSEHCVKMDSKLPSWLLLTAEILVLILRIFATLLETLYHTFVSEAPKSVDGEIILITGTGHGMGRELAIQYGQLNATIICVDINKESNDETVQIINDLKQRKAYGYVCDVSNEEQVNLLAEKIKTEVGDVTMLVNNAGIMPCHRFFTYTPEEIRKLFGINVYAHMWLLQKFLPDMVQKNHGHIVTLSSMAGVIGVENLVPYCATKFAVRGMIEALHEEIRSRTKGANIKFTIMYPYMVDTGLCKKPIIRFPSILSMVSPKQAACQIIDASRRDITEQSIPKSLLYIQMVCRFLPLKCAVLIKDFLGSTLDEDDIIQ